VHYVCFEQAAIWPDGRPGENPGENPADDLLVEIFEHWLEPA
jgi:hypothetical protein